jgi:hypothetical protein
MTVSGETNYGCCSGGIAKGEVYPNLFELEAYRSNRGLEVISQKCFRFSIP